MKLLSALVAAGIATLVLAASSGANVPPGNGLDLVPASPFGLFCEDSTNPFSILLTHGGSASTAWRVESNEHYVLSFFSITTTVAGTVVFADSKTWGVKAGLDSLSCSAEIVDGLVTTSIAATIHPLP